MIRIVLLDDAQLVLEAVAAKVAAEPGFQLAGIATDCQAGLALVAAQEPDLVVMEVGLPGRGSFATADEILRSHRGTRVVFLTGCLSDVLLDATLGVGVAGYLLKDEPFAVLFEHLRKIVRGERRFSARVEARLQRDARQAWLHTRTAACLSTLTHLQFEILRHLARGDSVKEVAVKSDMSPRAIEGLKYRMMQQLGLHDRVALARFAIREGLTLP